MRFVNDRQRKACFAHLSEGKCARLPISQDGMIANLFSHRNQFSLYFDDFTGDVRSDTIADVALRLNANMPIHRAMAVLNKYPDQDFSGVKKIDLVDDKILESYGRKPELVTVEKVGDDPRRGPLPKLVAGYRGSVYESAGKEVGEGVGENVLYQSESDTGIEPDYIKTEYRKQVENISPWGISDYRELAGDVSDEVAFERALQRYKHPSFMEARAWRMGKQPKVHLRQIKNFPRRKYERKGEMSIPLEELNEEAKGQSELKAEDLADMIEMNKMEIVSRLSDDELVGVKDYLDRNPASYYDIVQSRIKSELERRKKR